MSETVGKYEEIMQSIEQQKEAHNALIQGYEDKKAAVESIWKIRIQMLFIFFLEIEECFHIDFLTVRGI